MNQTNLFTIEVRNWCNMVCMGGCTADTSIMLILPPEGMIPIKLEWLQLLLKWILVQVRKRFPVQGLEPWYPAWKASMLTTYIISELLFFAAHKFQKIIHNPKQLYRKYSINLLPSLMLLIVTFYQSIMVLRRSQLYFHFTRCLACFVYQLWMTEDKQNDS